MAKLCNQHLYLFLGPEIGEKNGALQVLLKKVKAQSETSLYKFYPYDADVHQILSLMGSSSLFGETRFVVFSNFDDFKKPDLEALIPLFQHQANDLYIVVLSDAYKLDKRLEEITPESNKRVFWELKEDQKANWIRTFFKNAGRQIENEAVNRLLELVENNTQELKTACEAIVGFYDPTLAITEKEIDDLIVHSKEESVFTLFNKLAGKQLEESAEVLMKMALSPDGIGVATLTMLAMQFRKVLLIKELLKQGQGLDEAYRSAGVSGKKSQAIYKMALDHYSLAELHTLLANCTQYDAALRSGLNREMIKITLESFLLTVCKRRRGLV